MAAILDLTHFLTSNHKNNTRNGLLMSNCVEIVVLLDFVNVVGPLVEHLVFSGCSIAPVAIVDFSNCSRTFSCYPPDIRYQSMQG